jgi:hypothetical protein
LSARPTWPPAAARTELNKGIEMALLNLFYQGNQGFSIDGDGTLWYQGFDGSQWHGVQHLNIGGSANLTCAPSPVLWRNIPHIMHQGSGRNGQLWVTWYDGSIWRPDQQVPGVGMSWSPSAVVFNNNLYVFHSGYAENGELWYTVADGTSWSQDHQILSEQLRNLYLSASSQSYVALTLGSGLEQRNLCFLPECAGAKSGDIW